MSRIAITGLLLNNVRDFGAVGDGVTDDRAAIQAAIDDAVANGFGGIFFPAGVFSVGLLGATNASMRLSGVSDFRIAGTGPKSIVRFAGINAGAVAWAMFRLDTSCNRIYFDNLTLDGNRANVTNTSVSTRLIFAESTSTDVDIDRVIFTSSPRIGCSLNGTRVAARNCRFLNNAEVALNVRDVLELALVEGCFFASNLLDDISVVPTAALLNSVDIIISECFVDKNGTARTMLVSGLGAATGPLRLRVCDSTFIGTIEINETPTVSFCDNFVEASVGRPLELSNVVDRVLVTGNTLRSTSAATVFVSSTTGGNNPDNLRLSENLIIAGSAATGVVIDGGTNVTVNDNTVLAFPGGTSLNALNLRSIGGSMNLQVRDNDLVGTWTSEPVVLNADPGSYEEIIISHNRMEGTGPTAIRVGLTAPGAYTQIPEIVGNVCDQASLVAVGAFANFPFPAFIAGGGGGRGVGGNTNSGTQFVGTGSPEGVITASRGATFQRVDGGAGTTLFTKETGDLTNTGWVASTAYGRNYQTAISTARTTTTSNIFQTKVTLTTPALTGTFRVGWKAQADNLGNLGEFRLQNTTDAATVDGTQIYKANDNAMVVFVGGFAEVVFAGAAKTFEIQWRSQAGGDTQGIAQARIEFWRVS